MKENNEKSETGSGTGQEKITGTAPDTEIPRERKDSTVMTALTAEPGMEELTDRIPDVPEAGRVDPADHFCYSSLSHGVWFRNGSFGDTYGDHRRHYRTAGRRDRPDGRRRYVSDPYPGVSAAFSPYSSCLCGRGAYDDGSWYPAAPGFHLAGLPGVPGSIPLGGGSDPESPAQRYPGR